MRSLIFNDINTFYSVKSGSDRDNGCSVLTHLAYRRFPLSFTVTKSDSKLIHKRNCLRDVSWIIAIRKVDLKLLSLRDNRLNYIWSPIARESWTRVILAISRGCDYIHIWHKKPVKPQISWKKNTRETAVKSIIYLFLWTLLSL